jgi:hypothetical protein
MIVSQESGHRAGLNSGYKKEILSLFLDFFTDYKLNLASKDYLSQSCNIHTEMPAYINCIIFFAP